MNSRIVSVAIGTGITLEAELDRTEFGKISINEDHVEDFLSKNIGLLIGDRDALVVGRQVVNEKGGTSDLVLLDGDGSIVVVEIKRDPKDCRARVEAFEMQAIRYAANYAKINTPDDLVEKIYTAYVEKYERHACGDKTPSEYARSQVIELLRQNESLDNFNTKQKIILAASGFDPESLSACAWLAKNGIDISCVQITPVPYRDNYLLVIEKILPPPLMEDMFVQVKQPRTRTNGDETVTKRGNRVKLPTTAEMIGKIFNVGDTVYIKGNPENSAKVVDYKNVDVDGTVVTWNEWVKKAKNLDSVSIYHYVTREPGGKTLHDIRLENMETAV
jgi:hypothetical protein